MNRKNNITKYRQDLKKLSRVTDPQTRYTKVRQLAKAWECSVATIYRDLRKPAPGTHKVRDDRGVPRKRATMKEFDMFRELIIAGKTIEEARAIVQKKSGRDLSSRKANELFQTVKQFPPKDEEQSNFGGEFKKFIEKYFELDMMSPVAGIKIKLGKISFNVSQEDVTDIVMILVNAYNRSSESKLKLDRKMIVKMRIEHLIERLLRDAEERMDIKSLEAITRMKKRLDIVVSNLSPNLKVLQSIVTELKPEITFDEIYHLVQKHSIHG